jgi:hypothetical protein
MRGGESPKLSAVSSLHLLPKANAEPQYPQIAADGVNRPPS